MKIDEEYNSWNLEQDVHSNSEERFRLLFENMMDGFAYHKMLYDCDGNPIDYVFLEVNSEFEKHTGLKRENIIGKRVLEILPNASGYWIETYGRVAKTGIAETFENYSASLCKWYVINVYSPQAGYFAVIIRDITKRKNDEEELRKTRMRLEEAQEFANLGFWELDRITGENLWSDELFRICGFKPQEFIPVIQDFIKLVHPDDKELIINIMRNPIIDTSPEIDFRIIRSDAENRWVHVKIKYRQDLSGKLVRTYGIVQDITERKLSEIDLKESEEKFKELAENLGEVIWVRQNEQLVYINPAYEKVWGRTCQSLYDDPDSFLDAIHPEDKERIVLEYTGEKRTVNGLLNEQYKIIRPDGTIRWIWDRSMPILDKDGKMIRCIGIADDITIIKEYEEESLKNKMEKEMAHLDRLNLVGQMAAGIGHEVRNPMTTVRGFLQLLSRKEECTKYWDFFALMIEELDRANSIITNFLSLAKDRVVELEMQSIKEIVENLFPLIQADGLVSDKYINLELEEVEKIPLDKKEIRQLVLNLVQNGTQAMSPGGTMKIRTFMDKEEIVLSVVDDGEGIPQEVLEKLGTPFFTTKENGTGLGLAVCYSIAARHNAKIEIETCSKGTTFFVRFRRG
ncbi:PAS domain-containing protein [Desulfosporosinus sp. SYSU MS00001]|uniref:PAS domain-containing protein n=1 Tax=Desulfosporosinus sp. SYSU MS00001 TaxID=3416284 RepID=UPI003CFB2700